MRTLARIGILLGAALVAACSSASSGTGGTSTSPGGGAGTTAGTGGTGGAGGATTTSSSSSSTSGTGGQAACAACVTVVSLPAGSQPYGLFVDATNVYWTDFGTGEVMQAKLDGSAQVPLATGETAPISVQALGGFVYWVSYSEKGVARKAPVGGGPVVDLSPAIAARDLFVGPDYMWWTGEPDDIQRAPAAGLPDGGAPILVTNNVLSNGLTADASHVYWVNRFDGHVKKADYDLGNETALATGDIPFDVAVDDASIYWTEQGSPAGTGKVMKASKADGSNPTVLATDGRGPQGIAIDASFVYWTNKNDGTVKRVPLAGGVVSVVAAQQGQPTMVAVDQTHVYWTNFLGDSIVKAPK